ncbi:hypothetical protein [Streptomyces resistomycificus]|uniref:Uncharacterized protein n=1 Tax=Streptomyces resistomycificus TaxID=67356 RepID=A0A0L8L2Y3_9ACTN|nr:hypothetical protein [Streptomyces resistomycificus]KOG32426.1 hypothetical protein ADK37_27105 [Streptomyces resistomycificus]KUN91070.1 hypothetical protein AQJ84_38015 [Streptomyces resistomycificus]
MTAEHDGRAGADALMAAITDEPLPDTARADPAFLAEHRSAQADLALLREQLGLIGHALAEPPAAPRPAPVRPSRSPSRTPARRRAFNLAFGALAVTAAAAVLSGMGWLLSQAPSGAGAGADSGAAKQESGGVRFGSPRYLACARTVAEGTVLRAEELPDGELLRVTVRVTRYYKPAEGEDELTYVISRYVMSRLPAKGDRVLFGAWHDAATPDSWVLGERAVARERAWITASLPESRGLTCS